MKLLLLSLVAGITLGVTGTTLGKVSRGREEAEDKKEGQLDLNRKHLYGKKELMQDKPKKTKRDFFITGGYSGMTTKTSNESIFVTISFNESKVYHLNSSEKEKGERKGHREPKKSLDSLNLPGTILLQLLNQTKAMNRSSEMDFIHWNVNGNITRDLCEDCCKETEKPNLGKQAMKTLEQPRKRRPGQWTILGRQPLPLGNSSINMVMMMFHNGSHIGYQAKRVTQKAENPRGEWCKGCCKDDETLEALERREREV